METYPVYFQLKEGVNPICSIRYQVTKVHKDIFKKDVEHLVLLGVLEIEKYSEWRDPPFAQHKPKRNRVRFSK